MAGINLKFNKIDKILRKNGFKSEADRGSCHLLSRSGSCLYSLCQM